MVLDQETVGETEYKGYYEDREVPTKNAILSWLDCSRPLESVTLVTASTPYNSRLPRLYSTIPMIKRRLPLVLLDSSRLQAFLVPMANITYWCWCDYSDRDDRGRELEERPHFAVEEWKVESSLHISFGLTKNGLGLLSGLKFDDQNDWESPV
ncbi:hypothetical protein FLONG3_7900 [Fusarium longipes]|uniref:Uncharacterized protein n=1 Tax=Fusarium longipes TaxID=694270 RepID=A0A395SA25_9HYPO|nr:hypothetical protein FLONG3_7900 [Fusarium longipes]